MLTFMYDHAGCMEIGDKLFTLYSLDKDFKTKTINNGVWKTSVKKENIKISPKTYYKLGNYCLMFGGYDYFCYLCGHAGTTPTKCKCKDQFSIGENEINIRIARKNYLFSIISNNHPELLDSYKNLDLSPDLVDQILFGKGKYGERLILVSYERPNHVTSKGVFENENYMKVKNHLIDWYNKQK